MDLAESQQRLKEVSVARRNATIDDATKALLLSTAANWRAMGQAEKARTQRAAQLAARYLSEPPATNK